MILKEISVKNYRTLENVNVGFNGYYTAISGKNNAGKSNLIRAIRGVISPGMSIRLRGSIFGIESNDWKNDITSWKIDRKEDILIEMSLEINRSSDAAIYKFLTSLIFKDAAEKTIAETEMLKISYRKTAKNEINYSIIFGENEVVDDYQKQEVFKRIRTSECLIFYNSTQKAYVFDDSTDRLVNFIKSSDLEAINRKKEDLVKTIQKSLKNHQNELTELLGTLEDKYEVSLSTQGLNFEREVIDISLKEKGSDVSLEEWGSGTRNRTLIFQHLLNAKRAQQMSNDTDRITPIVMIEEPECYLHPQAQAEFGRILQDLANEFKIQIIVTTHSPYMLSFENPESNILIERNTKPKSRDASSHVVDTKNDKWYEPFALALGLNKDDFGPMKDIIFTGNSKILLVEGMIDKEYFEYFQNKLHGSNALRTDIEIFPYDGADNLKNTILMNFIKKKFSKVVVTVDLDRFDDVKKSVTNVGFVENVDFFPIGVGGLGKECIEGLLPMRIFASVMAREPELSQTLVVATGSAVKEAKSKLKKKLLEEFVASSVMEDEIKAFYSIVKKINKAFN